MKKPLRPKYSFSIIGSGNLAWHFSQALVQAGHEVISIYSRNENTARELASEIKASVQSDLDFSSSKAQIFILAVPENAISEVLSAILLPPDGILLSVSGTFPLKNLISVQKNSAVCYPLQTFSKSRKIDFNEVPLLIEAPEPNILEIVINIAYSLTDKVYVVDSAKREKIHLAAVFASNFTNYLLYISKNLLEKEWVDFNIVQPLVSETIQKAFSLGPKEGQTGPAVRGDYKTWQRHLQLLNDEENLKNIYNQLSLQIKSNLNNS